MITTLSNKLQKTLLILLLLIPMLGYSGIALAQTQEGPTTTPTTPEPLGVEGDTLLDTGGFLSGGTISGGASLKVGQNIVIDASYMRPLITLAPLELYSLQTVQLEVQDPFALEYSGGAMTGFGLSYIDEEGYALFIEARLWLTASYNQSPSFTPEIALITSFPSDLLFD